MTGVQTCALPIWLWCGFGVALVWLWCGLGVALVWLWCGFVLRSLCLVYAYYMALGWLGVASGALGSKIRSGISRTGVKGVKGVAFVT